MHWMIACLVGVAIAAAGAMSQDSSPDTWQPERLAVAELPIPLKLHARVISGGLPEGDAAFAALKKLGVRTIITVDGARPDVERAARHGMRYVHLPHGYDGIPAGRVAELAKAVRDLPGPIYIHCHHGQHRSPAAAAVACIGAGLLQPEQGPAVLQAAGTSPNYRGLFTSVAGARRIDDARLAALQAEFPQVVQVPPIADAMVQIEHTHDRLKLLSKARWGQIAAQPDLDAAHEALLLKEHFRELARTPAAQQQSAKFQALLKEAEERATTLEQSLLELSKASPPNRPSAANRRRADAGLSAVSNDCKSCHQQFRDVPLGEKSKG